MIYIDFWNTSDLTVSIRKKPFTEFEHFKVVNKKRELNDNLRYWIRKALSHWTQYSILLMNCHDQADILLVPSETSTENFTAIAKRYFINLPKNIIKGMAIKSALFSEKDPEEKEQ